MNNSKMKYLLTDEDAMKLAKHTKKAGLGLAELKKKEFCPMSKGEEMELCE